MRRTARAAVVVGAAVVLLSAGVPAAGAAPAAGGAAVPNAVPGGAADRTPDATLELRVMTPSGLCVFSTKGDYVHISSSAFEASGHGWWKRGDCPATTAVVTVQLQQHYSDGSWRDAGSPGKATVGPGGGAGNRATGRARCHTHATQSWRSVVDVDLVGLADSPDTLKTPARTLGCRN